jgi:hypothetical protein
MTLREVAGWRYSIFAVCDDRGECQVERFLLEIRGRYPRAVRDLNAIMQDYVPQHGPPFEVEERAKRLRDDICEFRSWQRAKKKGRAVRIGLRVLFFEDGAAIVCTSCFEKPILGTTLDDEIDLAIGLRARYFQEKTHQLTILRGWGV